MEYKELATFLLFAVQGMVIYIFSSTKKEIKEELMRHDKKIEKLETGDFVEKIVKNVIYSPESRSYFKSIFSEALNHKAKNNDAINLAILDHLEKIENKLSNEEK